MIRKKVLKSKKKRTSRNFGNENQHDFEKKHPDVDFKKIDKNLNKMIDMFIEKQKQYYEKEDLDKMMHFFNENLKPIFHANLINNEIYPNDTLKYLMETKYIMNKNRNPRIPTSKFNFFIRNPLTSIDLFFTNRRVSSSSYRPSVEWCKKIDRE